MACKHQWHNVAEAGNPAEYRKVDWCTACGSVKDEHTVQGNAVVSVHTPRITKVVRRWVKVHNVNCPEAIEQVDSTQEDMPSLVEKLCKIVGYYKKE